MPTVYVLYEQPSFNYTPAEDFGQVAFVLNEEISGIPSSGRDPDRVAALISAVRAYDFEAGDSFVLTGSPYVIALAGAMLARFHDSFRVLVWDASRRRYTPRVVCVSDMIDLPALRSTGKFTGAGRA